MSFESIDGNMRWLTFKHMQVRYWVNKASHFGNTTTSRNESSHAAIKAYLRNGRGDHKHFFDAICVFWQDQHLDIVEKIDAEKIKPKTSTSIMLFVDVMAFVHNYALQKIVREKAKLRSLRSAPVSVLFEPLRDYLVFMKYGKTTESRNTSAYGY